MVLGKLKISKGSVVERHNSLNDQFRGLLRLTRWNEHVAFVIPLTLLGSLLAVYLNKISLDWRLFAIIAANIIAVSCGFMINDIEDAPDDARDPDRAARNPIASGEVPVSMGYRTYYILTAFALFLYFLSGIIILLISLIMMVLSHLYSWRPVRLKALPIVDILSHSVLLGGFLAISGYLAYSGNPGKAWWVIASATFGSVYGQFYNQLRDYDMDKAAGLYNTAIMLGPANTKRIMYVTICMAVFCLIVAIVAQVFPVGLIIATIFGFFISSRYRGKAGVDMRGGQAVEASGAQQIRGLIVFNCIILCWFFYVLAGQMLAVV